ncbi:MAG: ABC transporter substrate-binding protein [Planctomycetota bacterium]|nr:ABC transporter substrate-binding protein [Planctomycetota bacterium]
MTASREFDMISKLRMPALIVAVLIFRPAISAETVRGRQFSGEVVVGATFSLTGFFDYYGQSSYYGAITRVKQINEAGGINGKKLVIEWRDNRGDPKKAARDVEELVGKFSVSAIIGPLYSNSVIAVNPVATRLGVPIVTPLADINMDAVSYPWVFRISSSNTSQVTALVNFQIEKYGSKTCAIIYDGSDISCSEYAKVFHEKFTARGGTVIGGLSFMTVDGKKDYETPLRTLSEMKPDFIFAPCYASEATELIYTSHSMGFTNRFCGPELWDNELLFIGAGVGLVGSCFASALLEESFRYRPLQTFISAIREAGMDEPDAQAASAYDAVSMLAVAMENGEYPEMVRESLSNMKNMNMVTGRATMDENHNVIKPVLIRVVERKGDRLVPVYADRYDP